MKADGLRAALQRFLDAESALEGFDDRADHNFGETGEQADPDRRHELWVARTLALAGLRDYDPLNGVYTCVHPWESHGLAGCPVPGCGCSFVPHGLLRAAPVGTAAVAPKPRKVREP